jgi:hypothetical protein
MATQAPVTLPAPQIMIPYSSENKWQREFEAFQRLRPDLLRTHAGQYVLIHNGKVVDSGPDDLAMALRFFAEHGKVPIHIGLVTLEPEAPARIPHYRTTPVREMA